MDIRMLIGYLAIMLVVLVSLFGIYIGALNVYFLIIDKVKKNKEK